MIVVRCDRSGLMIDLNLAKKLCIIAEVMSGDWSGGGEGLGLVGGKVSLSRGYLWVGLHFGGRIFKLNFVFFELFVWNNLYSYYS